MDSLAHRRIPQLDGIRGLAILLVVGFHCHGTAGGTAWAPALSPFVFGWCGVDLFFVLSGFLIGGILLDNRESADYFRAFYVRRACRIIPIYAAFLCVAAISFFAMGWRQGAPWWTYASFVQNFWMASNGVPREGLAVTWSLAVEEQFYLVLPAIVYFVRPRLLPRVLVGLALGAAVFRVALFSFASIPKTAAYCLLPSRMDSLLAGVLLAYLVRIPAARILLERSRLQTWGVFGVLVAIVAAFVIRGIPATRLGSLAYTAVALMFACLLALSLVDRDLARALSARWLTWLGGISYGVYLLHGLILDLVGHFLRGAVAIPIAVVATLSIAKVSWEGFEKPIIRIGHCAVYGSARRLAPASQAMVEEARA